MAQSISRTDRSSLPACGIWLPVYGGWLRAHGFDTPPSFGTCLAAARAAEAAGFDLLYASENLLNCLHGPRHDVLDAWMTLCGVAAAAPNLALVGALKPVLRPALLAAQTIAGLDQIGQGRAALNLVCGWSRDECEEAEVAWRPHDDKYAHASAYLDRLEASWSGHGDAPRRALFNGRPRPEIWLSGHSNAALALAGRRADVLFVNGMSADDLAAMRARLDRAANGRPVRLAMNAFIVQGETDDAALRRRDGLLARANRDLIALYGRAMAESGAESWRHLPEADLIDGNGGFAPGFVGTADTLRRRMKHYAEAGADIVLCQFPDMDTDITRFGRSILRAADLEARQA